METNVTRLMPETKIEAKAYSLEVAGETSITYRHVVPPEHTLQMCMEPTYWRHGARELGSERIVGKHAWNRIELIAEDGSWEAGLRVTAVRDGLVFTRLLRHNVGSPRKEEPDEDVAGVEKPPAVFDPSAPAARPRSLDHESDTSITFRYFVPEGHSLEHCRRPEYWRQHTQLLAKERAPGVKGWHRIELIAEDGTWEAEVRVEWVKDGLVFTRLLSQWPATAPEAGPQDQPADRGRRAPSRRSM